MVAYALAGTIDIDLAQLFASKLAAQLLAHSDHHFGVLGVEGLRQCAAVVFHALPETPGLPAQHIVLAVIVERQVRLEASLGRVAAAVAAMGAVGLASPRRVSAVLKPFFSHLPVLSREARNLAAIRLQSGQEKSGIIGALDGCSPRAIACSASSRVNSTVTKPSGSGLGTPLRSVWGPLAVLLVV